MRRPKRSQAEAREARSSSRAAEVCASCPWRPCLPGDAVTDLRGRSSGLASRPGGPRGGSGTRPSPVGRGREGGGWAGAAGGGRAGPRGLCPERRPGFSRCALPAGPCSRRLGRVYIRPARGGVPARRCGPRGKCERWRLRHAPDASYITSVRRAAAHGDEKRFGVYPPRLPRWQPGAHPPSRGRARLQGLFHGEFQCV